MAARPSSMAMPFSAILLEEPTPAKSFVPSGLGKRLRVQWPPPVLKSIELAPRRRDAGRARRIGERNHAVGIADVKRVGQKRHPERLVQPLEECVPDLGDAVAVRVAQKRDAVGADPDGGGPFHRAVHGVVEEARDRLRHGERLGDKHVAIRQDEDRAGMLEVGRKGVDLEPGRRRRRLPLGPSLGGRHFERRDALSLGGRDRRPQADGRLERSAVLPPQHDRGGADHLDNSRDNIG